MKFYNTCKLTFGDSIVLVLFNQDSLIVLKSVNSNCSPVCSLIVIKIGKVVYHFTYHIKTKKQCQYF